MGKNKNRKKHPKNPNQTEVVVAKKEYNPEEREAKVLQNKSVIINRLSVEILVGIISLAIPNRPFAKILYQCVRFSSVCHHWRLAILNHAAFWKFIIFNRRMTLPFFEELRSRFKPSEVMVRYSDPEIHPFLELLRADADHVKTLYVVLKSYVPDCSNLLPFFPSLENIFCHPEISGDGLDFNTLRNHAHTLKALQVTVGSTKPLKMAKDFQELRWLNIKYMDSLSLCSIMESLQALPNLQVLYLHPEASGDPETELPDRIVTLPELRVLISKHFPVMHLINAPKLTYADILVSDEVFQEDDYTLFCGFDFSRITHICSMISTGDPYIMGKSESEDVPPFTSHISRDADGDIFDLIPTSYPNRFHFTHTSFERSSEFNTKQFIACLKQATSLTEIVLNKFVTDGDGEHDDVFPFFDALTGATTVRHLNILSGGNFQMLCDILSNGAICPNLERLTYSSSDEETQTTSHLHSCLQKLMKERSMACSKPLEVEIKGFDHVQPGELEQIEKLMLRFNQTEREGTPICFKKEDYFEEYD